MLKIVFLCILPFFLIFGWFFPWNFSLKKIIKNDLTKVQASFNFLSISLDDWKFWFYYIFLKNINYFFLSIIPITNVGIFSFFNVCITRPKSVHRYRFFFSYSIYILYYTNNMTYLKSRIALGDKAHFAILLHILDLPVNNWQECTTIILWNYTV